jgi:hypothetical protein
MGAGLSRSLRHQINYARDILDLWQLLSSLNLGQLSDCGMVTFNYSGEFSK